ncbi:MAG: RagB/SusD family nutrient uptake outer membrane protein [Bacteroidales bacterium]
MKRLTYIIITVLMPVLLLTSCDLLEPDVSNIYTLEDVKSYTNYAEGLLLTAYRDLPQNHNNFNLAYGSDDAVTNIQDANVKTANDGGWTSNFNPFSVWNGAYESLAYINTFLAETSEVDWYWEFDNVSEMFANRLKGEAYGLRAWYYFGLLQAHAGRGANGEMLGVPIVDRVLDASNPDDYVIPRSSFDALVEFIITDCDSAIALLPDRYRDVGDSFYKLGYGSNFTNRINGLAVRLIKTKTLLYAASPAYSEGSSYTYQQAAESAAELMDLNGGLSLIGPGNRNHLEFYSNNNVTQGNVHPEVFWYSSRRNINGWEVNNYPPSLYGEGRTNPTQELVNAFPLVTGIPADISKINSSDPYSGRDPRLSMYILYNGSTIERSDSTLVVKTTAGSQDAIGSSDPFKSLTGYYLKKFMNINVNVDPAVGSNGVHYYVYARYTDVLLMFAEAANEAVGPEGDIGGYTAKNVINAIRNRAGITSQFYVDLTISNGTFDDLIRNERRLEMCFENQRFWDLRRWKMIDVMKKPVHGVQVSADGTQYIYVEVEKRNYQDYQIYGPIPYGETLKYDLVQNEGWN